MNNIANAIKQRAVVIGLGKTGFSCVRFLVKQGYEVAVIDSREQPPYYEQLRADYPHVPYSFGSFTTPLLDAAHVLVISPGVSPHEAAFASHRARGIPIIGDIELFARTVGNTPVIAITGANGKSTVTTIVGEMAKAAGLNVKIGGNLGTPALDLLDPQAQLYVLELSSFQLETTFSLRPRAATVLNISPDHIDRHGSITAYCAAKWRIYHNCATAIINHDDPLSFCAAALPTPLSPAQIIYFSLHVQRSIKPNGNGYTAAIREFSLCEGYLTCSYYPRCNDHNGHDNHNDHNHHYQDLLTTKLLSIDSLKIKGLHQVANALAALALGTAAGLSLAVMLDTLRNFSGLPHRCQWVANINGVNWYNDSKGTNVGATEAAIAGLGAMLATKKLILIAGGLGKGADFAPLYATAQRYLKAAILIGKDAPLLALALQGKNTKACNIIHATDMHTAVLTAAKVAIAGDIVLLSPACASFDMFDNFEHRGTVFTEEVLKLKKN